jgi:hypothetical protein
MPTAALRSRAECPLFNEKVCKWDPRLIHMFLQKRKVSFYFPIPRIETRFLELPKVVESNFKSVYSSIYYSFATAVSQLKIFNFSGETFKGFEVL